MADSLHPNLCLHPERQGTDEKLRAKINNALLWNGACPVYTEGEPAFYAVFDLKLPRSEEDLITEHLRLAIAQQLKKSPHLTDKIVKSLLQTLCRNPNSIATSSEVENGARKSSQNQSVSDKP
jgi:hypothetical protein